MKTFVIVSMLLLSKYAFAAEAEIKPSTEPTVKVETLPETYQLPGLAQQITYWNS